MFQPPVGRRLCRPLSEFDGDPAIARNAFVSLPLSYSTDAAWGPSCSGSAPRTESHPRGAGVSGRARRPVRRRLERLRRLEADGAARRRAERAAQRLERLHAFTGTLAEAITPAQVVDSVIDMGLAATSAQSTALWLSSPDGASLVLSRKVGSGGPGSGGDQSSAARYAIACRRRRRGPRRRRRVDRVSEPARRAQSGDAQTLSGEGAFACLPLLARGRRVGVLTFGFEGTHRFLEDERAFLQVIAWYCSGPRTREHSTRKRGKPIAEGRVPRDARPRAAQPARADRDRARAACDLRGEAAASRASARSSRASAAPRAARRRSARRLAHHARQGRARAGAVRAGLDRRRRRRDGEPARSSSGRSGSSSPCRERGLVVDADQARLAQAIANLLTNAAKYTAPGGAITVDAQRGRERSSAARAGHRHRHRPRAAAAHLRSVRARCERPRSDAGRPRASG